MDQSVIAALQKAGMDSEQPELLRVPTVLGAQRRVLPLEGDLPVPMRDQEDRVVWLPLRSIAELWTGSTIPPDFAVAPPSAYEPFFLLLEATAAEYCDATHQPEQDREFERLYLRLCQRPDSTDPNPLFSYLRAAARLYLSLRDVSRPEFEAVTERLRRTAKTFVSRLDSTNYHRLVLGEFLHP